MTPEQNYDYYPGLNLKIIQNDFLAGRIEYLNEMSITEKKESDKAFKAKLKDRNDNYYTRTYFDLVPDYNFTPINGKWNYTPGFIKPADPYNWSVNSKYPADYDYGANIAHPDGRAFDIWRLKTADEKVHTYTRGYHSKTITWDKPEQPALIHEFEEAFKNYGKTQTDPGPTENVWGPWFLYTGSDPAEENVLARYPNLINVRTKDKYIEEKLEPGLDKIAKEKRISELSTEYDEEKVLMGDIMKYVTVLDSGDDYPRLKKHWEHRHHGHYSVK